VPFQGVAGSFYGTAQSRALTLLAFPNEFIRTSIDERYS
jgi:hypothetical protein